MTEDTPAYQQPHRELMKFLCPTCGADIKEDEEGFLKESVGMAPCYMDGVLRAAAAVVQKWEQGVIYDGHPSVTLAQLRAALRGECVGGNR
jgi:hypothetical protein